MKPAKEIKHLIVNLYCKTFGGDPDNLEIWDGPKENYTIRRKEDGLIATIPMEYVDLYLSDNKHKRDEGKAGMIDAFQDFKDPIEAGRISDRYSYDRPEFVYVKFKIEKGPEEERVRVLNVIDSSQSGLALLITQKDANLLEILEKGDKILDMSFFGTGIRVKKDGTVKHMTKITEGKFKGSYVLGVGAPDIQICSVP